MNKVERVLCALNKGIPDKVPYMHGFIDQRIREEMIGHTIDYKYLPKKADWSPIYRPSEQSFQEPYECVDAETADVMGLDAIGMQYMTPVFAEVDTSQEGTVYIRKSLLSTPEDLKKIRMPDVDDEAIYKPAMEFVKRYKGEYALFCRFRMAISPTMMSMGTEEFCYAMYDEPDFVKEVVSMYTTWVKKNVINLQQCGFDFLWSFDDMAFKSAALFSNEAFNEFFFPYMKNVADAIKVPWVFHSDGNLLGVLDDLSRLGMSGIHPLEPGAMDLSVLKNKYGKKLCLIGNVDIDHCMTTATPEEIDAVVKDRVELLAPGGGYIISDSNSIPFGVKVENIREIAKAVERHRYAY